MEKFTVELFAANYCGVLHHVSGVFAKCRLNIERLTLEPATDELSVMRISACGDLALRTHLLRLLSKLYDVKSVTLTQQN